MAGENYTVYVYFHNSTARIFDAQPLLEQGGVFLLLRDMDSFHSRLTVLNNVVAWDIGISGELMNFLQLEIRSTIVFRESELGCTRKDYRTGV